MMIGNPYLLSGGGKELRGGGERTSGRHQVSHKGRMATRGSELCHRLYAQYVYMFKRFPISKNIYLASTNAHFSLNMRSSELAFVLLCASALTSAAPLAAAENGASVAEVIRPQAVARSVTGPAFDQGQPIDGEGNGAVFSGWQ